MDKKILVFIPNCNQGGTERVAVRLSQMLKEEAITVTIVTLCKNDMPYNLEGIEHIALGYTESNKVKRFISRYKKLKDIVKRKKITHIVSMGEYPNILNAMMGSNVKKIARVTNSFSSLTWRDWLIGILTKIFYKRLDLIITPSKYLEFELEKYFGINSNIKTIYNFLDIKAITDEREKNRKIKRIVHIGQLVEQKAQHYLIEAINKLRMDNGKWRIKGDFELVIIGKGEREKELKELVKKYKLEDKIRFLGWQDNPFYWLQNSDVFVLTSRWEGMPNVLIEAMACKCPVISFDCPSGPNEIIDKPGENGVLLEVGDVEGLSESIANVLNDEEYGEKLSKNAYKRALDFDVEKIYLGFKEKIEKVLISG